MDETKYNDFVSSLHALLVRYDLEVVEMTSFGSLRDKDGKVYCVDCVLRDTLELTASDIV